VCTSGGVLKSWSANIYPNVKTCTFTGAQDTCLLRATLNEKKHILHPGLRKHEYVMVQQLLRHEKNCQRFLNFKFLFFLLQRHINSTWFKCLVQENAFGMLLMQFSQIFCLHFWSIQGDCNKESYEFFEVYWAVTHPGPSVMHLSP